MNMKQFVNRQSARILAIALVLSASDAARAQTNSFRSQDWQSVSGQQQQCLNSALAIRGLDVYRLQAMGIRPDDPRLRVLMQSCYRGTPVAPVRHSYNPLEAYKFVGPSNTIQFDPKQNSISDRDADNLMAEVISKIDRIPDEDIVYIYDSVPAGLKTDVDGNQTRDWSATPICIAEVDARDLGKTKKFANVPRRFGTSKSVFNPGCLTIATTSEVKRLFSSRRAAIIQVMIQDHFKVEWANDGLSSTELDKIRDERIASEKSIIADSQNLYGLVSTPGNWSNRGTLCLVGEDNKERFLAWLKYELLLKRPDIHLTETNSGSRLIPDLSDMAKKFNGVSIKTDLNSLFETMKSNRDAAAGGCAFAMLREDLARRLVAGLVREHVNVSQPLEKPFVFSLAETDEDLKKFQHDREISEARMEESAKAARLASLENIKRAEAEATDPNNIILAKAGQTGMYCKSGWDSLQQVLSMRSEGTPIDTAKSYVYVRGYGATYNSVMVDTVNLLYQSPDLILSRLKDGTWMKACVTIVGGHAIQ